MHEGGVTTLRGYRASASSDPAVRNHDRRIPLSGCRARSPARAARVPARRSQSSARLGTLSSGHHRGTVFPRLGAGRPAPMAPNVQHHDFFRESRTLDRLPTVRGAFPETGSGTLVVGLTGRRTGSLRRPTRTRRSLSPVTTAPWPTDQRCQQRGLHHQLCPPFLRATVHARSPRVRSHRPESL